MSRREDTAPFRVAVVGAGWAARTIWLPRLRTRPGVAVTAVIDPDRAALAAAAGDDLPQFATVDNLRPEDVDLAVVAVPNHLHADVAESLLTRGISVFVEKPVCLTPAEADRLAAAESTGGAILLAGSASRYRADVRALLEAADTIGTVRHISARWVRARGIPTGASWFTHRRLSGGGALMDLGWHLFDAVAPLLGATGIAHVAASTTRDFIADGSGRAEWRQDDDTDLGGDVEDTARGFLVTKQGTSLSLTARWASHRATDVTSIVVEGSTGVAGLTCTFGFSPNRQERSVLTLTRDGVESVIPVAAEPIGEEYGRMLDELPLRLADPRSRGAAIGETRRTITTIERMYCAASGSRQPVVRALTSAQRRTRAVIFDLDGVLVDSFEVMRRAFAFAYREVVGEGEPPFEEYNQHLGRYFTDIMEIMGLPPEMEDPFVRESTRLSGEVTLFPGVVDLLCFLRGRGISLAVATGKAGWRARALLDRLGVLSLFDHVIGSDEVPHAKPAPDIVLHALELMKVDAHEAIMVGDAVTDIAAARGAEVMAVAALWGETDETVLLATEPDLVLRGPAELAAWWQTSAATSA